MNPQVVTSQIELCVILSIIHCTFPQLPPPWSFYALFVEKRECAEDLLLVCCDSLLISVQSGEGNGLMDNESIVDIKISNENLLKVLLVNSFPKEKEK